MDRKTALMQGATTESARIQAMFKRIRTDGEALALLIETAAISCILCAVKHNDANTATLLVKNTDSANSTLHAGVDRARAIGNWLQTNGPLSWDGKAGGFKIMPDKRKAMVEEYEADPEAFKAKLCDAPTYFELTKPSKPVSFSLIGRFQAAIKEAKRYQSGEKRTEGKVDYRGLEEAEEFLHSFERHLRVGNPSAAKGSPHENTGPLIEHQPHVGDDDEAAEDQAARLDTDLVAEVTESWRDGLIADSEVVLRLVRPSDTDATLAAKMAAFNAANGTTFTIQQDDEAAEDQAA